MFTIWPTGAGSPFVILSSAFIFCNRWLFHDAKKKAVSAKNGQSVFRFFFLTLSIEKTFCYEKDSYEHSDFIGFLRYDEGPGRRP